MKYYIALFLLLLGGCTFAEIITGEISKQTIKNTNRIYDSQTNIPIEGVLVKIPAKNYATKTDSDGTFSLKTEINAPTIMSLEKSGYKPYSMTLSDNFSNPIQVGIEKTSPNDIIIETNMIHIGDNSFSERSANASEFSIMSSGAFYSKDFSIKQINQNENLFMIIGSIIGIDTIFAQRLGQSHVLTAYSSPPEIFFNGNKISDIKINGDNQKIQIPTNLIKFNQPNNITIKTGRNLQKVSAIDLDDIEFTNLLLEVK
ncbi:hypothetical protein II906_10470 [bacterium]|nr:hypothetical protein [bacterium]